MLLRFALASSLVLAALSPLASPLLAHAQPPEAALIRTEVPSAALEDFGGAIDRVLRARVQHHGVVALDATPALGFEDIQLMVGCLSESTECFAAFAAQLDVEVLFLSSLERAGEEYIISVSVFDARDRSLRSATRRASRDAVEESLIDSLDGIVRELFGLPEPSGPSVSHVADDLAPAATDLDPDTHEPATGLDLDPHEPATHWRPSWAGVALSAFGVAALAVGGGVFALGRSDEDAYLAAPVSTPAEIDAALDRRDAAERALNAGLGTMVAGAALAALGLSLTFALGEDAPVQASLALPDGSHTGAPLGAAVSLTGSF